MEPEPDHCRQDLLCLGLTICGSICPGGKDKHKIGNSIIILYNPLPIPINQCTSPQFGKSWKWQPYPKLGWLVCLCRLSNKPDKALCKQGLNRSPRDHPDGTLLAKSGVVPRPSRSLNRLSIVPTTFAKTAQAVVLAPLSSGYSESQPSCLEVIKWFHKERGT